MTFPPTYIRERADHIFRTLSVLGLLAVIAALVLTVDTRQDVTRILREGPASPCTVAPRGAQCQDILERAIRGLDARDACFIIGLGGLPCIEDSRRGGRRVDPPPGRGPAGPAGADGVPQASSPPAPPSTPGASPAPPPSPPAEPEPPAPPSPPRPPEPPTPVDPICERLPAVCETIPLDLPVVVP